MNLKELIKQGEQLEAKATSKPWQINTRWKCVEGKKNERLSIYLSANDGYSIVPEYDEDYELVEFMRNNFKTMLKALEMQDEALEKLTKGNWPKDKRRCSGSEISQTMLEGNCELAHQIQKQIQELLNEDYSKQSNSPKGNKNCANHTGVRLQYGQKESK
jgi:hypothetical protein